MTPVRLRGSAGFGGCILHAAMIATAATRATTRVGSDVRMPLTAIDRDTRAADQARLSRAQERDHRRHLFGGAESPEGHLEAHELGDAVRVCLLAAMPAAALPQDRPRRHRVD